MKIPDQKKKKKSRRNSRSENYNEKFTRIERLIWTIKRISELEDKTIEIFKAEEQREKRLKKN